jgi:hypothetical protein
MEQCTVETGLLKKKPCGEKAITKCGNCEQPLCSKHAVPQMSGGKKTGGFLCPPCAKAWKESERTMGALPGTPAAAGKKPEAPKPAAATPKPAAVRPAAVKPAAMKPAAAPVQQKKPQPPQEDSGPLEFTPSKPEDKK